MLSRIAKEQSDVFEQAKQRPDNLFSVSASLADKIKWKIVIPALLALSLFVYGGIKTPDLINWMQNQKVQSYQRRTTMLHNLADTGKYVEADKLAGSLVADLSHEKFPSSSQLLSNVRKFDSEVIDPGVKKYLEKQEEYREWQKRIVGVTYSVDWFDNEKISVRRADGSNETIWQRPVADWENIVVKDSLSLSPDGIRIAYAKKDGDLFVMNSDGTLIHQLTSTKNAINSEPVWFDKNTVGFKTKSIDDVLQYFWISLDAHNNIAKCSQYTPKEAAGNKTPAPFFWWHGNEKNVAGFYLREKNGDAKLVQETKNYPDIGKNFAISPDETRVLYINGVPELEYYEKGSWGNIGGSQIRLINLNGTNDKELTPLVKSQQVAGGNTDYILKTVTDFNPVWISNSSIGFKRKSMDTGNLGYKRVTDTKMYRLTLDKNNTGHSLQQYAP